MHKPTLTKHLQLQKTKVHVLKPKAPSLSSSTKARPEESPAVEININQMKEMLKMIQQ